MYGQTPSSKAKLQKAIFLLQNEPLTRAELAEKVFCGRVAAVNILRFLRDNNVVYIVSWREGGRGAMIPSYRLGSNRDAPRPKRPTPKQHAAMSRKLLRSDPEKHMAHLMRRRAK
jgi:hypothetical protein